MPSVSPGSVQIPGTTLPTNPAPGSAPAPTPSPTPAPTPTPTPSPTPTPPTPTPAALTITITGIDDTQSFSPNPARVQVDQPIVWRNGDSIAHTATQDGTGFDTGLIAAGATSAPITLAIPGTYTYHDALFPSMVGTLIVVP